MKIKKKMWYSLLSVLWIFILVFPVMASEIPEERQKPLLVDEAGLLTEEESSELLNKLEDISQRYENEVGIVTVNSLEGKTAEAYADDYYDYNGYGYGENDDGLLLLISMGEREWAISTYGYSHTTAFTDAGLEYIRGEFQSKLSSGEYAKAFVLQISVMIFCGRQQPVNLMMLAICQRQKCLHFGSIQIWLSLFLSRLE